MRYLLTPLLFLCLATPVASDPQRTTHGGDIYLGGSGTSGRLDAERDVIAAGNSLTLGGEVAQDIQAAGFSVDVEATAAGDLFVAGATVTVRANVGEDLSAAGFTVRTSPSAVISGNARLAGGTVTIEGPVRGALTVAAGEVILNAPISGDAWITAQSISFGADAAVAGEFRYATPDEISIPERVVAPERVVFERLDRSEMLRAARETWEQAEYPVLPTAMSLFAGFVVTLAFFILLGATFLAFAPRQVQRLRVATLAQPGMTLLIGVIGLSILFGLVPISAMTIVGIPLVPIVLLCILAAWLLGYVFGAYVLAMRFWQSFGSKEEPTMGIRLAVLAAGIVIVTLLNFIPFLGWIVNFTLVLLGIGAMTRALFDRIMGNTGPDLDVDLNPITEDQQ